MPETISSVEMVEEVEFPYTMSGIGLTSQGHLVVLEAFGSRVDVYTRDLVHVMAMSVTGARCLWDVARRDNILFMTERDDAAVITQGIHVISDTGVYSYKKSLTWNPCG